MLKETPCTVQGWMIQARLGTEKIKTHFSHAACADPPDVTIAAPTAAAAASRPRDDYDVH